MMRQAREHNRVHEAATRSAHSEPAERCVGIVGLGLIGGSIAHDLHIAGVRVLGLDRDDRAVDAAIAAGVVQASLGSRLDRAGEVDTLVIAVPVHLAFELVEEVAVADATCLVMDVGSTKRSIVDAANATLLRARFVGAHPLSGDHRSGFAAARPGLFRDAAVYLCPAADTPRPLRERAVLFWQRLGAQPQFIDAAVHDGLLAWTSHLPQAVASALARALYSAGIDNDQLGPGGRDSTRLAASDPDVWAGILLDNAHNVTTALLQLTEEVETLRRGLDARDRTALRRFLEEGRALHSGRRASG